MYLNNNLTQVYIPELNEKDPDKRTRFILRSLNQTNIYQSIMNDGFVLHQMLEGETYWSLAVDYYDNQDKWIYMFYVNNVHPVDLRPGDVILVPTLGVVQTNSTVFY